MSTNQNELIVPEGWEVGPSFTEKVQGKTVGPEITKKSHLVGDQDKSELLESELDMSEDEYKYWSSEHSEQEDFADDGKKYTHTYTDSETGKKRKVRYGAKGYRISPGTKKGDSYCARSYGDMKSEGMDCSGKDKNTPMCLSRKKWKCNGKKSSK